MAGGDQERRVKLWLVRFTSFGFKLDAVVVHRTGPEAVALLELNRDSLFDDIVELGTATGDLTPRVVTEDKLT